MKVLILVAALIGACSAAKNPAALGSGQGFMGANTNQWTPFQCRDGVLGPNDARMGEIGACANSYGPGKKNGNCVYFCQATALGLLDTNGLPQSAIYDKWVQTVIPQEHHGIATAWFRDCYVKYGKFIDQSDNTCKFAKLFGDCTWAIQPSLTCPK